MHELLGGRSGLERFKISRIGGRGVALVGIVETPTWLSYTKLDTIKSNSIKLNQMNETD